MAFHSESLQKVFNFGPQFIRWIEASLITDTKILYGVINKEKLTLA